MENIETALKQANECLNCKNPMCRKGCPIATNIPEFIAQIKQENFLQAYNILQENNFMSEICSNICPTEKQCMGKCIKGIKGKPVEINNLEKFVNNWAKENNINYSINIEKNSYKKFAVIGSGPAGLSCAIYLRKAGSKVTVFEKEDECGGILRYGIPDFRLPKNTINDLINRIKKMGINFETGVEFGKDITIEGLKKQGYESIFLGLGAQQQIKYRISNADTKNIYTSSQFLKNYNCNKNIKNLGITVVIGGGNVAIDSARVAQRMGATKTYILYRRNIEHMPARKTEIEEALKDNVLIIPNTKVIKANAINGEIKEIECINTKIENDTVIDLENSNYKMQVNTIVFAIGSMADEQLLNKIGASTKNGLCSVNENYMTNIQNVYAGGDLVETKSSVCKAIATGKKAANAILGRKESDT